MHFQKSARLLLVSLLCFPLFLSASENKVDKDILSKDRQNLFNLNDNKNEESSSTLKKDWINPINLSFTKSFSDSYDSTKSTISISQPIFKSGGIFSAIKYANASYKYNQFDIEIQRKELIRSATTMLFNLHITDLNIKKNEFLLKNANIDIIRKKEQVLNGFLDTSYLDNAILDANKIKNGIAELRYQKEELNNNFSNIASGEYKSFELPALILKDKKQFINDNIELAKAQADIEQKDNLADMTIARYLPTVNVNADHSQYHDVDNGNVSNKNIHSYGISVTMPLDVRTFNEIETQKISYLTAKLNLKNIQLEEENFYKTKLSKLNMLNEKKKIAQDDYKLYESLLTIIIEEKNAELKTQSDVDTLLNSQKIKSIELNIYKLEEQIELLEIYSKIS